MNLTKFKAINIMTFIVLAAMAISNVFLATVNAYGTELIYPVFYAYGEAGRPEIKIVSTRVAGVFNMVLPSTVSAENVTLFCDYSEPLYIRGAVGSIQFVSGQPMNLHSLCYPVLLMFL